MDNKLFIEINDNGKIPDITDYFLYKGNGRIYIKTNSDSKLKYNIDIETNEEDLENVKDFLCIILEQYNINNIICKL